jgi:hypothetical protein
MATNDILDQQWGVKSNLPGPGAYESLTEFQPTK